MHHKRSTLTWARVFAVALTLTTTQAFANSTFKVIEQFYTKLGSELNGRPVFDPAGNLYGVSLAGGPKEKGTVFQLTPGANGKWSGKVLHNFGVRSGDGEGPVGGLVLDSAGNLYGATESGGSHGKGTVFELVRGTSGWTERVLHNFGKAKDGAVPNGDLIFDAAGNLYGTTQYGGAGFSGTVFQLVPGANDKWTENVLYTFCPVTGCADGRLPTGGLIFDAAGNLYGTALYGGANNAGVVFELSLSGGVWTEKVLYAFCSADGCPDGANPFGGVIFDAAGNLYGTASGTYQGTIFELTPSAGTWTETTLFEFCCNKTGLKPNAPLIFDTAGNLYDTTEMGGRDQHIGVAFELSPAGGTWTETILHDFGFGRNDGVYPAGGLIFDSAGNLYGFTATGYNSTGVAFEITP